MGRQTPFRITRGPGGLIGRAAENVRISTPPGRPTTVRGDRGATDLIAQGDPLTVDSNLITVDSTTVTADQTEV